MAAHKHTLACVGDEYLTCVNPAAPGRTSWKRPMGKTCEHGRQLMLVNGSYVRNHYDSDWVQGGHHYRYPWCPVNEIWIDETIPKTEWPLVILHECIETELMMHGMGYGKAHDIAKREEDRKRHREFPGDRRKAR